MKKVRFLKPYHFKGYNRMAREGEDFWKNAEEIMYAADDKKDAKGVPLRELVNKVHTGSRRDEDKIKQVKEKVERKLLIRAGFIVFLFFPPSKQTRL